MTIEQFKTTLFSYAKSKKLDNFEVYIQKIERQDISCLKGGIKSYSTNIGINVNFRFIKDYKQGLASTTFLNEDSAKNLVDTAIKNNEFSEIDSDNIINNISDYIDDKQVEVLQEYNNIEKIVVEAENYALNYNELIDVHLCKLNQILCETNISNSKGLDKKRCFSLIYLIVGCKVEKNGNVYTFYDYAYSNKIKNLNYKMAAESAAENTIKQINSKPIKSTKSNIIIKNDVFISFIKAFENIFSSEDAEKSISLLKNKENEKIASDCVTIIDCGSSESSNYKFYFDDEGNEIKSKKIIDNGVFKTFLYNNKWAKKLGKKSTGNGFKESVNSEVKIKPCIFYLKGGKKNIYDMIKDLNNGILITQLSGIHAGTNKNTGEFSLESKGFLIKNGDIDYPIEGFTISGNFYDILKNISEVGNDLIFDIPNESSHYGSPSVIIKDILIAGI